MHHRSLQYIAETSSDFSLADRSLLILTMLEVPAVLASYTERIKDKRSIINLVSVLYNVDTGPAYYRKNTWR